MSVPGLRRENFPAFDRFTYLNTASAGLVPAAVLQQAHEFEAGLAQAGTTGMDEDTEVGILEGARNAAAGLLHADPSAIAIATSFTEALCQVAWWLRPGKGQNVVSSDADFPSVTYPWHRIAEDTGCQVRLVSVLDDPEGFDVDKIARQVDSGTAAICISHIQYLTGHLLDLNDLAALAHQHGALLIIDATQSAGQVPIDVTATGVDVLITGSYKWLCSLFGAAACYLSPRILETFRPPFAGWRSGARNCSPPQTPRGGPGPSPPGPRSRQRGRRRRAHPPRGDRLPPGRLHPVLHALLQQQRGHPPGARHARRGAPVTPAPATGR
jgi:cysteine desulfurase / selenocysteine lyase